MQRAELKEVLEKLLKEGKKLPSLLYDILFHISLSQELKKNNLVVHLYIDVMVIYQSTQWFVFRTLGTGNPFSLGTNLGCVHSGPCIVSTFGWQCCFWGFLEWLQSGFILKPLSKHRVPMFLLSLMLMYLVVMFDVFWICGNAW